MGIKDFIKIYRYDFVILWLSCVIFVLSCYLFFSVYKRYKALEAYYHSLSVQEYKILHIKNVLSRLQRYRIYFNASVYKISVDKKIDITPFDKFIYAVSSVYDAPGFFILDSFYLQTCLDPDLQQNCTPYSEIKGWKFLTNYVQK